MRKEAIEAAQRLNHGTSVGVCPGDVCSRCTHTAPVINAAIDKALERERVVGDGLRSALVESGHGEREDCDSGGECFVCDALAAYEALRKERG